MPINLPGFLQFLGCFYLYMGKLLEETKNLSIKMTIRCDLLPRRYTCQDHLGTPLHKGVNKAKIKKAHNCKIITFIVYSKFMKNKNLEWFSKYPYIVI